jgi:hypothetical protein
MVIDHLVDVCWLEIVRTGHLPDRVLLEWAKGAEVFPGVPAEQLGLRDVFAKGLDREEVVELLFEKDLEALHDDRLHQVYSKSQE